MGIFEDLVDTFEFKRIEARPKTAWDEVTSLSSAIFTATSSVSIGGTNAADTLIGTSLADLIVGYAGNDFIEGRAGADTLIGGAGGDVIYGNAGDDLVLGGNGRDVLIAGAGQDTLTGGAHADTFILGDGVNVITDFQVGVDTIFVQNMARNLVDVSQVGSYSLITYSGSATLVLNTDASDISAAIEVQTSGFVQVNDDGWGDSQEVYAWAQEVFDDYLYVSTLNVDGTQGSDEIEGAGGLYRYDGSTGEWETISTDGLGNDENDGIRNLLVFNDVLYAGTLNTGEGAELLRSTDGLTFDPVITGGFGRPELGSVRALYEFEGALYVGFQSLEEGLPLMLLRSEDGETFTELELPGMDRFNYANNDSLHALTEYDGYLYAGTRNPTNGFELYRSDDGIDWDIVIGPGAAIGSGIDGNSNTLIYHMIEYNGALYIGTGNFSEGFEVHRSFDGVTFEQVGENGFGDDGNNFAWRFHEHEGELYLGTNFDGDGYGGGNVFRTSDGKTGKNLLAPMEFMTGLASMIQPTGGSVVSKPTKGNCSLGLPIIRISKLALSMRLERRFSNSSVTRMRPRQTTFSE